MSEETWRPLGVETEGEIAEYDALHDGIPRWMAAAFWAWVRQALSVTRSYQDGSGRFAMVDTVLAEEMVQALQVALPNLRSDRNHPDTGKWQLQTMMDVLGRYHSPLRIADYLLAHGSIAKPEVLDALLHRSKSSWKVGMRSGRQGLVRRVPLGVQIAADDVMQRAGRAGVNLAKAWEELYGLEPNASEAYRRAIVAVEDAAIPVVSPKNNGATLGTVLKQIEDQGDWRLPMDREHDRAPSKDVLVDTMRMLWHGQHDRHGGQPSAPGNVSLKEATVAVSLAVTLVSWFDAGLVGRGGPD